MILLPAEVLRAQLGCTDNAACNYDAMATEDDGSCIVPLPANAGPDMQLYGEYTATINAINSDPQANGYWTVADGAATFDNATLPSTTVSNLALGSNTLLWHQDYACASDVNSLEIYVFDNIQNEDDEFINFVGEESALLYECEADTLPYITATDNCNGVPTMDMVSEILSTEYCRLETPPLGNNPCGYIQAWSFALFGIPMGERSYKSLDLGYRVMPSGKLHVYGKVFNAMNPNAILLLDFWYYDAMSWTEWSTQEFPTNYKADCNGTAANHPDWTYYKLESGQAVGEGDLAGTTLNFSHSPANLYFGFQLGTGANNVSPGFGFGGWMKAAGHIANSASGYNADVTNLNSDIAGEAICCASNLTEYTYTAVDDCDHSATFIQRIEVRSNGCGYACPGCIDPDACNYNSEAIEDDGSCEYTSCIACTDLEAANYDPNATINQGCLYYTSMIVFNDINGDAEKQLDEQGLQNWPLYISTLGSTVFTNENGKIELILTPSPYIVELINNSTNWINTTPLIQNISVPSDVDALFGLQVTGADALAVIGPYDGYWDIIHCTDGYEAGVHIANTGSIDLHGQLTLTCDPLFIPEADVFATIAPDVTSAGYAEWNILNFETGQVDLLSFHIDGPGIENLGDEYTFVFHLVLYDQNDEVVYDNTWNTTPVIGCSHEPNDITADPVGYAEPHYVLPAERIEFRIRFQNLDNIPAQNILIQNAINEDVFDITTFEPLYGSASYTSCLHDEGTVDFIFADINLPPSTTDEEASHGFVVYSIEVHQTLTPGTMLYNEAFIVFDENSPIQTNEVFHSIFDCESFENFVQQTEICEGESISFDATQPYVDTYSWYINDSVVSEESTLELQNLATGDYAIVLEVANPMCGKIFDNQIVVHALPTLNAGNDVMICEGEEITLNATSNGAVTWSNGMENGTAFIASDSEILTATATNEFDCIETDEINIIVNQLPSIDITENGAELTAPSGSSWQWYWNGEVILGATEQVYLASTEGAFYVITTNSNCVAQSETVFISSVGEGSALAVAVYPNPMRQSALVMLPVGIFQIALYDQAGKLIENFGQYQTQFTLERKSLAAGSYQLMISNHEKSSIVKVVLN